MEEISKKDKTCAFLYAIAAVIIMLAAYQGDSTLGTETLRKILRLALYGIAGISFVLNIIPLFRIRTIGIFNILAMIPVIMFYFISKINAFQSNNTVSTLHLIYWLLFCLSSREVQYGTFIILKKIWCVICIVGIICFLSYKFGKFIPHQEKAYYINNKLASYIDFKCIYLYKINNMIRLCGICNEPGYFGTFCALILCASKLNLKDKNNIIIFAAGILTFSVAFLIIILVYLLLKSWKNWKAFVAILMLLIVYIYVIPNLNVSNESINRLLNRITFEDNELKGNNRSNTKLDNILKYSLKETPWFGKGKGYIEYASITAVSTYKTYVIEYGIIGCLLIWGTLLISVLYKNTRNLDVIFFIAVFFLSIYQRPNIMTLPYEILLYGGILYIKDNKKEQQPKTAEDMLEIKNISN